MIGMNRKTGGQLSGDEHLEQSITDIITTPIGTRLWRRDYGSIVPMLLDQPITRALPLLVASGVASALARWERRIVVRKVSFSGDFATGQAALNIAYRRKNAASNALSTLTIPFSR